MTQRLENFMRAKKPLSFFFILVLSFILFSCGIGEDTLTTAPSAEEAAQQIMESASGQVSIANYSALENDFTLPSTLLGTTVTWVTNAPSVLIISETTIQSGGVAVYPVIVNRSTSGDAIVTLTATFSYGSYTHQATYGVTVKAEVGLDVYSTIETMHTTAEINDYVQITGFVYSIIKNGYLVIDASGVAVEISTTAENTALVSIGDEVLVKGTYGKLQSLYQIKNLSKQIVLSSQNSVDVQPYILANPTDFHAIDSADKTVHGQYYQLTVTPKSVTVSGVTNIYFYAGNTAIAKLSTITSDACVDIIENHLLHDITLELLYFYYDADDQIALVVFDGTESDLVVVSTHEGEAELAADVAALSIPLNVDAPLTATLPSVGTNGSTITWSSGDGAVATITGNSVSYLEGAASATVTLTATITYHALTPVAKMFIVQVNSLSTLTEIAAMATGTVAAATGKVYLILDSGYFIKDATGTLAIYTNTMPTVALGDTVTVTGTTAVYGTLKQLSTITSTVIVSNGTREIPFSTIADGTEIFENGKLYRISCTVKYELTYYNLYSGTTKIGSIYSKSPLAALNALEAMLDTPVTLEVYYYTYLSSSSLTLFAFDNVASSLTDAEKVARDLNDLTLSAKGYIGKSISLPDFGYYGTVFSYTSSNPTAVTINPGNLMTAIAFNSAAAITLTVSGTKGSVTQEKDFDITISALTLSTIPNIKSGVVGSTVSVEGIVTGLNDQEGFFIQDASGNGIYVEGYIPNLEVGNQVCVSAEITEQTGLLHNFRYLDGAVELIDNDHLTHALVTKNYLGSNLAALYNDPIIIGAYVSIDSLIVDKYENGYVYFYLTAIESNSVYLRVLVTDANMELFYPAASAIGTAKLIVHTYDGDHLVGFHLELPEYTDAQKLTLSLSEIPANLTVSTLLTMPSIPYGTVTNVVISANLSANITFSTGIFTVTPPETGISGTITLTVTVESASADKVIAVTMTASANTIPSDLFISEYIEGSSGTNKFMEIYNGTGAAIDLSAYVLELYSNGSATASYTVTLAGLLANESTLIVYNSGFTFPFTNTSGINIISNSVANWNGDDAIVLKHNGIVIDSFGKVGEDPTPGYWGDGTVISTKDRTLVRKSSIISGRTGFTTVFDPSVEWISIGVDITSNLGTHTIE